MEKCQHNYKCLVTVVCSVSVMMTLFMNLEWVFQHQVGPDFMKIHKTVEKITQYLNQNCSNNIIYNIDQTSGQTCLIYNMVPKCGSLGMRNNYRKLGKRLNYTSFEGSYKYTFINSTFRHPPKLMKKVLRNSKCDSPNKHVYYRHQPFADFKIISQKTPFYTNVIRDPVNHYISWYYYRRYSKHYAALGQLKYFYNRSYYKTQEWAQLTNMSFDECVGSNHEECRSSEYTYKMIPFFCGSDNHCVTPSEKSLAQAKRNVVKYFPVVGYIENYIQYLELCEVIWPQFFTGAASMVRNDTSKHKNFNVKRVQHEPSQKTKLIMKENQRQQRYEREETTTQVEGGHHGVHVSFILQRCIKAAVGIDTKLKTYMYYINGNKRQPKGNKDNNDNPRTKTIAYAKMDKFESLLAFICEKLI